MWLGECTGTQATLLHGRVRIIGEVSVCSADAGVLLLQLCVLRLLGASVPLRLAEGTATAIGHLAVVLVLLLLVLLQIACNALPRGCASILSHQA